jgi:hypothetical protein
MKPRLVGVALRNYWSPVFVRENPLLFSALMFLLGCAVSYHTGLTTVQEHGVRALFHQRSPFIMFWWFLTFMLTGCYARQYWRQITAGIAAIVPELVVAEYGAIILMLALILLVLAAPFWSFGAPLLGGLALASVGMMVGSAAGTSAPTGQSRPIRALIGLAMLPFMLLAFIPQFLVSVMFAPQWLAALILVTVLATIGVGLRYFPAQALMQTDALELTLDRRATRAAPVGGLGAIFAPLGQLIRWQPGFMKTDPLPETLIMQVGPLGSLLGQILTTSLVVGFDALFGLMSDTTGGHFHHFLLGALPQSLVFGLFASGRWLLNRSEWPFLFMGGRYGGRIGFARAMFRAHRRNAIQMATSAGLVGIAMLLLLARMEWVWAILGGLVIAGLLFGLSYATAIPLFWHEFGGKGISVFFQTASFSVGIISLEFGVFVHGLQFAFLPLAALAVLFGLAMERIGARRLAWMDWPLESEAVVV